VCFHITLTDGGVVKITLDGDTIEDHEGWCGRVSTPYLWIDHLGKGYVLTATSIFSAYNTLGWRRSPLSPPHLTMPLIIDADAVNKLYWRAS